jgi:DNA polymerase V
MGRGGKRAGAGRPKGTVTATPTKVMRVPQSLVPKVHKLIQGQLYALPLYSSRVSAGFPSPADDHLEDQLDLNEHLIKNPTSTFFVGVSGESMMDAGIRPNDILVVDKSVLPADGKIAIVFLNGEFTVKRLSFENNQLAYLMPENSAYEPIPVSSQDEIEIWGVVTHVIHAY